jgi:hypothetical protein
MIIVGGIVGMLHKPTNTREQVHCGPDQTENDSCWVIKDYEIGPKQSVEKHMLSKAKWGVPGCKS